MSSNESKPSLSPRACQLLTQLFGPTSNLNLPVGVAEEILEIRAFAATQAAPPPPAPEE